MTNDLYAMLGVERDASQPEIKKAYRDLARRFHPDKNPGDAAAEARFKDIAEAYRVLGDADLRARYDQLGGTGSSGESPAAGTRDGETASELFEEIFGTRAARHHQQRGQRPPGAGNTKPNEPNPLHQQNQNRDRDRDHRDRERERSRARARARSHVEHAERGFDLRYTIELTFEDAALGCEKKVMIPRTERCDTCAGTGARPGTAPLLCQSCGGSGTVQTQQGFFDVSSTCPKCGGSGRIIPQNCLACRGTGQQTVERAIPVKVPAGVDAGTRLKLKGEGNPGPSGGPRGDLYVVVNIKPHAFFKREDDDVVSDVPVTFAQAALGGDLEIPTLEGRVRMRIPPGSQTGRVFRLKGKGIPSLNGQGRGDQRVRIFVETPVHLSPEQRELIERLAEHDGDSDEGSLVGEYRSLLRRLYD